MFASEISRSDNEGPLNTFCRSLRSLCVSGDKDSNIENIRSSRLCSLPYPIMESLVNALDDYTLLKLRTTCKQMNLRLEKLTKQLDLRKVPLLRISDFPMSCERCRYLLDAGQGSSTNESFGFTRFMAEDMPHEPRTLTRALNGHICTEKTVIDWLEEQPDDMVISFLVFLRHSFNKEKLSALKAVFDRKNIRAMSVSLRLKAYGDRDGLVSVLTSLRTSRLALLLEPSNNEPQMFSDSFLKFISSIDQFIGNRKLKLPKDFYKFPPVYLTDDYGVTVDIESMKNLMKAWHEDDLVIKMIEVCLPAQYSTAYVLAEAIGLDHYFVFPFSISHIQYTNKRGNHCHLSRVMLTKQFAKWRVSIRTIQLLCSIM